MISFDTISDFNRTTDIHELSSRRELIDIRAYDRPGIRWTRQELKRLAVKWKQENRFCDGAVFINPNLYASLILSALLYWAGIVLARRISGGRALYIVGALLLLLCIPALSFLLYYLHLFDDSLWYIRFRSIPGIECAVSLCALFTGFVMAGFLHRRGSSLAGILRIAVNVLMVILIVTPFIKPILTPVAKVTSFRDCWKDGVCLQSGTSTCGPSSLATVFKAYGMDFTEEKISRSCYSCSTGTENWYLIRYAERNGFKVKLMSVANTAEIPCPSILGARLGGIGHFIILLGHDGDNLVIGDPLCGRLVLTPDAFRKRYTFDGFAMNFSRADREYQYR